MWLLFDALVSGDGSGRKVEAELAHRTVRQIPPVDPDLEVSYNRRNDAESINHHLDDTLWLRRRTRSVRAGSC